MSSRVLARDGNRTEPEPHEPNYNSRGKNIYRTRTEPNRTHQCDEPEPNPNLLTHILVEFDKIVDKPAHRDFFDYCALILLLTYLLTFAVIAQHLGCMDFSGTRFLSRVSILTRDIDIANLSVCLSVCPSVVTFRYQMKTA